MKQRKESVGQLYDRLLIREGGKLAAANFTVHKRLRFPPRLLEQGLRDSNDWLAAHLRLPDQAHILDAGCGVGGTLFALLGPGRHGLGLTLSPAQLAFAEAEAARRGLSERCRFLLQSYDEPLPQRFDLIICLEALAHSADLERSLANLSRHLRPGGQLLLLEDMATRDLGRRHLARILQQSWRLPELATARRYRQGLLANGLELVEEVDFTPFVRARRWPSWLVRASWWLASRYSMGTADIFVGGWAQEQLYREGLLCYRLMLGRVPAG